MAASSNKLNVLDTEDESDTFSEESDDFWFDTSEEDTDSESDTSSVVHESEPYEKVSDFSQTFVHGTSNFCISWCKWSECGL